MADRNDLGDTTGLEDAVCRLSRISDRTNLMIIDATLQSLPKSNAGYAMAAEDVRLLSRRILQVAQDYRASLAPDARL